MPEPIIAILVILGLVILFIIPNIKIVRANEVKVVERLGKFHKMLDTPGIHFVVPFIDRDIQTVSLNKEHIHVKLKAEIDDQNKDIFISYFMKVTNPKTYVYAALDSNKVIHEYIISSIESKIDIETIKEETISYALSYGFEIENLNIK